MSLARVETIDGDPRRHPAVAEAAALLRAGGLVAFPTETVYGLGADAGSVDAVERVFAAKGRPADNPLIVHLASLDRLRDACVPDERALALARAFWPGPLTLVLPATGAVRAAACRGLDTVAVRVPAHPVALALLEAADRPVAAPSANRSGRPSPTLAEHVVRDLGDAIPLVLDGGPCAIGIESTVLDLCGEPAILRPGAVTAEALASVLGRPVGHAADARASRSPGTRHAHYRPACPVVAVAPGAGSSVVGDLLARLRDRLGGPVAHVGAAPGSGELSRRRRPEELGPALYRDLRELEAAGAAAIVVEGTPDAAVAERLARAAAATVSTDQDVGAAVEAAARAARNR